MNNPRRKELEGIENEISEAQETLQGLIDDHSENLNTRVEELSSTLDGIKDAIDCIKSEEDDYRDCMPENMQGGDRYSTSESDSEAMDAAMDSLDSVMSTLEDVLEEGCEEVDDKLSDAFTELENALSYVTESQE
jgi:chromosome segregation ATPase